MNKEIGMSSMMDISTGTGMNKPHGKLYFAKYLPVEGGIRQGDKIQDALNNTYVCTNVVNGEIYCSGYKDMVYLPKKVKLFLCSRDISLHEECWLDGKKVIPNQIHASLREKCFKIIGEISPDATWVKADDEFGEEDLRICYDRGFLPLNTVFDVGRGEIKFDKVIAIKGPCGHFH